jgi:hypothetical protein
MRNAQFETGDLTFENAHRFEEPLRRSGGSVERERYAEHL